MKRYTNNYGAMDDAVQGPWVKQGDAEARRAELEAENKRLWVLLQQASEHMMRMTPRVSPEGSE